jgi:hypothetical protein
VQGESRDQGRGWLSQQVQPQEGTRVAVLMGAGPTVCPAPWAGGGDHPSCPLSSDHHRFPFSRVCFCLAFYLFTSVDKLDSDSGRDRPLYRAQSAWELPPSGPHDRGGHGPSRFPRSQPGMLSVACWTALSPEYLMADLIRLI